MPFPPHFVPRVRQRGSASEQPQQMAPLEATGLLPSVAGTGLRGSALPTASVITHPGCAMRTSVTPGFRRCQGRARTREDPSRGKHAGCLEKVGAANKRQNKTAPKTLFTPRQNRMALPQIPKGGKVIEKPVQKLPCPPARFSRAKAAPLAPPDMAPWAGPSRSETSFHALLKPVVSFLHRVPFSATGPLGSCSFFQDHPGEKAPAAEGEQRQRALQLQGKAKQKARSRGPARHFRSKWQGLKLPPVPSITNLNFSRNFTFSFFELPPHQGPQYWVQRQQFIRLLMKQLQ